MTLMRLLCDSKETVVLLQVFEGAQPVGPVAGVRQCQGQHQPPPGAGERLEGAQLDPHEGGSCSGQTHILVTPTAHTKSHNYLSHQSSNHTN